MNKNQRKILILILLLFSLFIVISSSSAALSPGDSIKNKVNSSSSGATIELAGGQIFKLKSSELNMLINKQITIKSNSSKNAIINLQDNGRAFNITGNGKLTLINITITNGAMGKGNGGAIYNNGSLSLTGCVFTKNIAKNGGAIYNDGSVTLTNCRFANNRAYYKNASYDLWDDSVVDEGIGGAIYNKGSLTLTNCTFTNNRASFIYLSEDNILFDRGLGGAIYNKGTNTLNSCIFTSNNAHYGGAIYNKASTILTGCTFTSNTATIFNDKASLTAKKCVFTKNTDSVIYNSNRSKTTLTDCIFLENKATSFGAAIDNNEGSVSLTGCTFTKNTAENGGAIHNLGSVSVTASLTAKNCVFTRNTATTGGAIFNDMGRTTLTGCSFTKNIAKYEGGGAIRNWAKLTLTQCTFIDNKAIEGGAILNEMAKTTLTAKDSLFIRNTAKKGGAIYNDRKGKATLNNCTFTKNTVTTFYKAGGTLTTKNCIFTDSTLKYPLKLPDLVITKVKKTNDIYKVTIKNKGEATAKKSLFSLSCSCKIKKTFGVKELAIGKSVVINLKFPSQHKKHSKSLHINYNKKIKESNYKNNIFRIGKI